jgi:hypothetical protein
MNALNIELAQLLGWKTWQGAWKEPRVLFGNGKSISLHFDTDANSMREVWVALWKRGVWSEFLWKACGFESEDPGELLAADIYLFLDDLPGQVKTAIKVLKDQS